jgi:hypothetical protein
MLASSRAHVTCTLEQLLVKRFHQLVIQHCLHKAIIGCGVTPGFQVHFFAHGCGKTRRPLFTWVEGNDVCYRCIVNKMGIEAYVVCRTGVSRLYQEMMANPGSPSEEDNR